MLKHLSFVTVLFCLLDLSVFSQQTRIVSPDGNLVFTIGVFDGRLAYAVSYKRQQIIDRSPLALVFEDGKFEENLKTGRVKVSQGVEKYTLHVGKASAIEHPYKSAIIPVAQTVAPFRQINVAVKVFNDGAAFRYEFPLQDKWTEYTLLDENTGFNFPGDPKIRTLLWTNFDNNHEGRYQNRLLSSFGTDTLMDLPALVELPKNVFVGITEAALRNYAGLYLKKSNRQLVSQLSPLPGQTVKKVRATLPHNTPWRVLLVSERIGALIESNVITSLNEEPASDDWSWLKPGKTTFHWWNGDIVPDTTFEPGLNFATNKYYIDFCARNNLEYHAVIGYGGRPWYVNDGAANYQPGPNTDVTKVVPGFDMAQVCRYAASKGVKIHTWVHWAALYPKIDEAFALFEKWGVSGMMVDFMDRDDQEMVNIQEEILRKAAKHKLYIQFHGAFKPTGLHRTYPNEFTREGTLNYENNKWLPEPIDPDHDITMPFTRLLAGATDYHLGGFRAVPLKAFKTQFTRPLMVGTRAHMLAMYVVLESYLASLCDFPDAYEGQPGFPFLQKVPTTWDETRVLDAGVDEFIVIARRKGSDWFIGGITDNEARNVTLPLEFLKGNYVAEVFADAEDTDINPNKLNINKEPVTSTSVLRVTLNKGGGVAIHLTPSK